MLTDIARHLPAQARYQDAFHRYMEAGDLVTAAHEWTHFLNEHLTLQAGVGLSAYYVLDDRYVLLSDPEGLRGIVPTVPRSLRGDLHELYLVQSCGNARIDPLYLLDEWVAYANDVAAAVDQLDAGKPLHAAHRTAVQTMTAGNVLEFTFYGFAVGMAVKQSDRAYHESAHGEKLRWFIAWNARRSLELHARAQRFDELSRGDARNVVLLRRFRSSPDTAEMRAWVKSDLGEDVAKMLSRVSAPRLSRADVRE